MLTLVAALTLMQAIPRPEHPRPDMLRADWQNLNGQWEFFESDDEKATPTYPDKINVPFVRESKLSGLERKGFVKNVWYRRTFATPKWTGKRTIFHIGACDYKTTVWVNDQRVGEHVGGNVSFGFDITKHLKPSGQNTVVVHAFDDTASGKATASKAGASCTPGRRASGRRFGLKASVRAT
jgi:beta-galactosidase/beta-glucuronidase